jgi:hypothetical protein
MRRRRGVRVAGSRIVGNAAKPLMVKMAFSTEVFSVRYIADLHLVMNSRGIVFLQHDLLRVSFLGRMLVSLDGVLFPHHRLGIWR